MQMKHRLLDRINYSFTGSAPSNAPIKVPTTTEKEMLNINEEDLKKAIVEQVSNEILNKDDDLSSMVRVEIKARMDKIFADRAKAQI